MDQALALPTAALTVVTGYFDAVRAAHLTDLTGLPRPILAVVLPFADELVPLRARAEMAAALRIIDNVVIARDNELNTLLVHLAPPAIARLEQRDAALTKQLIDHVRERQTR